MKNQQHNNKEDAAEILEAAKPFIRSILAFCFKLRQPTNTTQQCYGVADEFIKQLDKDICN